MNQRLAAGYHGFVKALPGRLITQTRNIVHGECAPATGAGLRVTVRAMRRADKGDVHIEVVQVQTCGGQAAQESLHGLRGPGHVGRKPQLLELCRRLRRRLCGRERRGRQQAPGVLSGFLGCGPSRIRESNLPCRSSPAWGSG